MCSLWANMGILMDTVSRDYKKEGNKNKIRLMTSLLKRTVLVPCLIFTISISGLYVFAGLSEILVEQNTSEFASHVFGFAYLISLLWMMTKVVLWGWDIKGLWARIRGHK